MADSSKIITIGTLSSYNEKLQNLIADKYYNKTEIDAIIQEVGNSGIENWTSDIEYKTDDIVLYDYQFYVALEDNKDTEFDSTKWKVIGSSANMENYYTKDEIDSKFDYATEEDVNSLFTSDSTEETI